MEDEDVLKLLIDDNVNDFDIDEDLETELLQEDVKASTKRCKLELAPDSPPFKPTEPAEEEQQDASKNSTLVDLYTPQEDIQEKSIKQHQQQPKKEPKRLRNSKNKQTHLAPKSFHHQRGPQQPRAFKPTAHFNNNNINDSNFFPNANFAPIPLMNDAPYMNFRNPRPPLLRSSFAPQGKRNFSPQNYNLRPMNSFNKPALLPANPLNQILTPNNANIVLPQNGSQFQFASQHLSSIPTVQYNSPFNPIQAQQSMPLMSSYPSPHNNGQSLIQNANFIMQHNNLMQNNNNLMQTHPQEMIMPQQMIQNYNNAMNNYSLSQNAYQNVQVQPTLAFNAMGIATRPNFVVSGSANPLISWENQYPQQELRMTTPSIQYQSVPVNQNPNTILANTGYSIANSAGLSKAMPSPKANHFQKTPLIKQTPPNQLSNDYQRGRNQFKLEAQNKQQKYNLKLPSPQVKNGFQSPQKPLLKSNNSPKRKTLLAAPGEPPKKKVVEIEKIKREFGIDDDYMRKMNQQKELRDRLKKLKTENRLLLSAVLNKLPPKLPRSTNSTSTKLSVTPTIAPTVASTVAPTISPTVAPTVVPTVAPAQPSLNLGNSLQVTIQLKPAKVLPTNNSQRPLIKSKPASISKQSVHATSTKTPTLAEPSSIVKISGLGPNTRESAIRKVCRPYGMVVSIDFGTEPNGNRYSIVQFEQLTQAQTFLSSFQNEAIDSYPITINFSN